MLKVTYEHFCDACGKPAYEKESFSLTGGPFAIPVPRTIPQVGWWHVCDDCLHAAQQPLLEKAKNAHGN